MALVLVMILAALIALIVVAAGLVIVQRRSDRRRAHLLDGDEPPIDGATEGHAGCGSLRRINEPSSESLRRGLHSRRRDGEQSAGHARRPAHDDVAATRITSPIRSADGQKPSRAHPVCRGGPKMAKIAPRPWECRITPHKEG